MTCYNLMKAADDINFPFGDVDSDLPQEQSVDAPVKRNGAWRHAT